MYTVRKSSIKQRYSANVQYFGAEFWPDFVPVQYHTIIAATPRESVGRVGRSCNLQGVRKELGN